VSKSLDDRISEFSNPAEMLRDAPLGSYAFPFPAEYTNWRDEQNAWRDTVVIFDQSFHMTDFYFEGKDASRLISDIGVNTLSNFGKNKAKQLVACNYDGFVIGDAILFGHTDEKFSVVGRTSVPNWVAYHAETGGYDVEVTRDLRTVENANERLLYRFQIQGPNALDLIKKVNEGPVPDIPFFNIGDLKIAGRNVRALNHSMSRMSGLEIHGPRKDGEAVLAALLEVGEEFGLRRGGSRAYSTVSPESGWIPSPMPAIYTGDSMKSYRKWLSAASFEATASLGGSFYSDRIEDYYQTPWDLGYGRHIKFDHEFIGRSALEKMKDLPKRKKVWLDWSKEDTLKIIGSMIGEGERYKYLEVPNSFYSFLPFDKILKDGRMVGLSTYSQYTANLRGWFSLAMVDEADAIDGAEVELVWGEEDGGASRQVPDPHVQTTVRATIRSKRHDA
jgi:vanillate/3-O-methylgallate O-demethylase